MSVLAIWVIVLVMATVLGIFLCNEIRALKSSFESERRNSLFLYHLNRRLQEAIDDMDPTVTESVLQAAQREWKQKPPRALGL